MPRQRRTSSRVAKAASRVLRDGRSGRDAKRVAASALSQAAPKRRRSR
jgi:hypothetical protein